MTTTTNHTRARTVVLCVLPYLVLVLVIWKQNESLMQASFLSESRQASDASLVLPQTTVAENAVSTTGGWDPSNPLSIPRGEAQALPSLRVAKAESVDQERAIYGGSGDKAHLGGFTEFDTDGISPGVWKNMISTYGVHSLLDVGCGRGISTSWFLYHGVRIKCAEGSHDAVEKTLLPDPATQLVEHDFSRGAWWPKDTYDAVWAVEFLEHVGSNFHFNYITAFRKAAILFVTSSRWGGWHHVEVHDDDWWIQKYESYGFRYSQKMSDQVKQWAQKDDHKSLDGNRYRAQHIRLSMKVFINPAVASLPQHAHLFPEQGCYVKRETDGPNKGQLVHRECGVGKSAHLESKLPESFKPLPLTEQMDKDWMKMLAAKLNMTRVH
jgi:hypothetical protein